LKKKKSSTSLYEFDFSISFAGTDRGIAEELAKKLAVKGLAVFYDVSFRSRLLGKRLGKEFQYIFGKGTRFFVPLVSRHYVERKWPQFEWGVALREAERRASDFILPIRLDDALLYGLPEDVGYLDLRECTIDEAVEILYQKRRSEVVFKIAYEPVTWVATFGLLIKEVMTSELLPQSVPKDYPSLCDWLEGDVMNRLQQGPVNNPRMTEASQRDGETLSVRIAFEWVPHRDALNFGELLWWEVLEVVPWPNIYDKKP
jgi:hypothetical protein